MSYWQTIVRLVKQRPDLRWRLARFLAFCLTIAFFFIAGYAHITQWYAPELAVFGHPDFYWSWGLGVGCACLFYGINYECKQWE